MQLSGRTVLVTGGARGIGLELTRQFVAEGAHVVAVGRDRTSLARLQFTGPNQISCWALDLTDPQATDDFIRELQIGRAHV